MDRFFEAGQGCIEAFFAKVEFVFRCFLEGVIQGRFYGGGGCGYDQAGGGGDDFQHGGGFAEPLAGEMDFVNAGFVLGAVEIGWILAIR